MKRHVNYLKYILRHKWFVIVASRKFGVPLWLALLHDWSKFRPSEWTPYAETFYKSNGEKQYVESMEFEWAWNHHQKRNKHHWQYWLLTLDSGETEALEMPLRYVREMVADWAGAGRAITGKWEYVKWYEHNKIKIKLNDRTRRLVEVLIH